MHNLQIQQKVHPHSDPSTSSGVMLYRMPPHIQRVDTNASTAPRLSRTKLTLCLSNKETIRVYRTGDKNLFFGSFHQFLYHRIANTLACSSSLEIPKILIDIVCDESRFRKCLSCGCYGIRARKGLT